jgi:hypothetical protein
VRPFNLTLGRGDDVGMLRFAQGVPGGMTVRQKKCTSTVPSAFCRKVSNFFSGRLVSSL